MEACPAERLGRRSVHVWLFALADVAEDELSPIDEAERARADGFAFEEDRRRFLAGRACLRSVCSRYVADPAEPFSSLSHSGDLIAVAVARREVGIDVEQLRGIEPEPALVTRACTAAQRSRLERVAPEERERLFLAQWVRKEAVGKALGVGLDLALSPTKVTAFPRAGGRRYRGIWRVLEIETPEGYAGAVAARGVAARLVVRRSPSISGINTAATFRMPASVASSK